MLNQEQQLLQLLVEQTTTDGSLQTDGGLSVAADAVIGDDLKLLSDSAVLSFGADSDTTLTHTDGTGLTLNSTNKLLFRDSALSISSSTDGQLDIDADTEVEIATTTLDLNGALDVSGASQLSGAVTVGVDGTGLDVKFFGDTAGSFLLWDQSDDALELTDSSPIKIGDSADMQIYHDGTNSYVTNSQGALKIATETSGIAVTIGHTTSEVTVKLSLIVTSEVECPIEIGTPEVAVPIVIPFDVFELSIFNDVVASNEIVVPSTARVPSISVLSKLAVPSTSISPARSIPAAPARTKSSADVSHNM